MSESMHDRQHYLFAVLLGIAGLLIILIFVTIRSQASDIATSTTSISNTVPTINSITVATVSLDADVSTVNPTESSTTNVFVHGTYTDNNGCDEVTSALVTTTVYLTTSGVTCDKNEVDCYKDTSASASCAVSSCSGGTDETGVYECTLPLYYFATTGGWTASVTLNDGTGDSTASTDTFTYSGLTGISVPSSMDFGNVAYGATSGTTTDAATYTVTNSGNNNATTVTVNGTDLTCTDGTIATSSVRITSSTPGSGCSTYSGMKQLATAASDLGITITKATASSTPSTATLCARVQATPKTGSVLSGACAGTATFVAN